MKLSKRILGIVLVCGLFLLTGCDLLKKSKLVCMTIENGIEVGYVTEFIGNTVNHMKIVHIMDLSKYNESEVEILLNRDNCGLIKSALKKYSDAFKDCNQTIKDNKINVDINIDTDSLSQEERKKLLSIDSSKKYFESEGFKCTLE